MPKISIDYIWYEYSNEIKKYVRVEHLRQFKLEEHQQIIENYCNNSKSNKKYRNIQIYDYRVLGKHKNSETQKEFNLSSISVIINKIIQKGFYKDLLFYWHFEKTNDGVTCQFKK